ncbi:hypothetical protein ARALYDRAFT_311814 [Arabidopsis lyrata subsp. lyrata]|uniref:Uncharacterized protein n=1 Tax=Arabidopsis lyrata subsp. lyrata TaxID=81972 RepID=D7KH38_ARALL|nr:hypothetical protein ARALYDRAFT_311814 [Arabidopsis lyrata subsp. lyrata]
MWKHLKNENSSPKDGKYNHKSGWLAGMLHVLDFHHWRTKNRPICWKTPRTHSLMRETEEQEPFLDSKEGDSKMLNVAADNKPTRQGTKPKKMMATKQVTEYVDFLEILRKEDVFVKILKDRVQIKSNPRVLPKSGSFPISGSSRPARIEHKQKENWYAPKQNGAVLTLNVPRDASQEHKPNSPSHGSADDDHGFNHAVINGFREIKKLIKNALKDRNHTKKKKKVSDVPKDDYMGRYSQLLEQSFRREGGELRSKSLKLSYEEKKSDSRDNKPQFFRRISSLSSLEVLGSFLTDLPRDSSTSNLEPKKPVDQDTNFGSKKSVLLSESLVRAEKEEKYEVQEERSQENHLDSSNQRIILQQDQDSAPSADDTVEKTETLLPQGLGLSTSEIYNHEEEDEDAYFCYVKKVLEVSGFLEEKWHSEEQPLNPSLLHELEIHEEVVNDKELLFDLVNEAIVETQNQSQIYFPKTYPYGKRYLDEVWGRVEWSLSGLGAENRDRSLDDIVGRDLLTKSDGWMNLQGRRRSIGNKLMWLTRAIVSVRYLGSYKRPQKPPWMRNPVVLYSDFSEKKGKVAPLQETRMRDRFTLYARGGEGGSGCSSVRRSRADRYGKPDGGNGGRGGDVILECTHAVWDFSGLQPHIKGGKAGHGTSKNRIGNRGEDKVLQVPIGTVIHLQEDLDPWELPGSLVEDPASEETSDVHQETMLESVQVDDTEQESLTRHLGMPKEADLEDDEEEIDQIRYNVAELTQQGQRIIIARGGEGGLGNVSATRYVRGSKFAKTAIRQTNLRSMEDDAEDDDERSSIKAGSLGSEAVLILELKSIADVGLVGLPNAGKSTLLGALSRAKPRVGHYAFTTLRPNLGNVNYDDFSMTVADIPGLIKGAHQNRGLGHNFLRHIERTKVLAYVVDLASGLDGCRGVTPWQQLRDLVMELEFHEEGLSDRSSLIVANKIDEEGAEERLKELERRVKGVKIFPVCAVLEEGVAELKDGLKMLVDGDGEGSERLKLENICVD